jgi:hypothetical protein
MRNGTLPLTTDSHELRRAERLRRGNGLVGLVGEQLSEDGREIVTGLRIGQRLRGGRERLRGAGHVLVHPSNARQIHDRLDRLRVALARRRLMGRATRRHAR